MRRKYMQTRDGRRIPCPKCYLCERRYFKQYISVLGGMFDAPVCLICLFPKISDLSIDADIERARRLIEKKFHKRYTEFCKTQKEDGDGQANAT